MLQLHNFAVNRYQIEVQLNIDAHNFASLRSYFTSQKNLFLLLSWKVVFKFQDKVEVQGKMRSADMYLTVSSCEKQAQWNRKIPGEAGQLRVKDDQEWWGGPDGKKIRWSRKKEKQAKE